MSHSESQRRGLMLAALILLAIGWLAVFGITLWSLHDKAHHDGFATARMHARNFEDHLTKTLQVIDLGGQSAARQPSDQRPDARIASDRHAASIALSALAVDPDPDGR
jgi:hypothetical protein